MMYDFNTYRYLLAEGGRGSGKSHSIARFILYACEDRKIRVLCGRETQKSIEESVYTLFKDLIKNYNLDFEVFSNRIVHRMTGSEIRFKGFREQGSENIKGIEGVDILWIDEAQTITKKTLRTIIPTIRKDKAKVFFSMNRLIRRDPAYDFAIGREDTLHINVNYFDNEFCTEALKIEAAAQKKKNLKDYKHIWLGLPLDQTTDYLFSSYKLDLAASVPFRKESGFKRLKVMGVDLSGAGGDLCVAKLLTNKASTHFDEKVLDSWSEPDTDKTIGRILSLFSQHHPDLLVLDANGMGYAIAVSVRNALRRVNPSWYDKVVLFIGQEKCDERKDAGNKRAEAYLDTKDFIDQGWLNLPCDVTRTQLEGIKKTYQRGSKLVYIQDKREMKKEIGESPDYADTTSMMVWAYKYRSDAILFNDEDDDEDYSFSDDDYNPFDD